MKSEQERALDQLESEIDAQVKDQRRIAEMERMSEQLRSQGRIRPRETISGLKQASDGRRYVVMSNGTFRRAELAGRRLTRAEKKALKRERVRERNR